MCQQRTNVDTEPLLVPAHRSSDTTVSKSDLECSASGWDDGVAEVRGVHRTFTGVIWDMPVALSRGRRPVINGHLIWPLNLAADVHTGRFARRMGSRAATAGTFRIGSMSGAQPARMARCSTPWPLRRGTSGQIGSSRIGHQKSLMRVPPVSSFYFTQPNVL